MRRFTPALLFLTLGLGACTSSISPTEAAPTQTATLPVPTATLFFTETPAPTEAPSRNATIMEVDKTVSARVTEEDDFTTALAGMTLFPSGGVETGDDGRARVDLLPEGTIVRVGPSSSFTIPLISEQDGEPKTTIELFFGKIFVLLNGGSLDVQTPSGVASVRGSLLSVEYDPETKHLEAACLEGHCSLKNNNDEEVELLEGESSFILGEEPPSRPEPMDRELVQDWLEESPEILDFIERLPDIEDFPEREEEIRDNDALPEERPEREPERPLDDGGEGSNREPIWRP